MRAEAFGMLAVSTFLGVINDFTNYSMPPLEVQFYADNKALITRMTNHKEYDVPFANQWLLPEADLIEEIYQCHQTKKIIAT